MHSRNEVMYTYIVITLLRVCTENTAQGDVLRDKYSMK